MPVDTFIRGCTFIRNPRVLERLQPRFGAFSLISISKAYYINFGGRELPDALINGPHFLGVALAHPNVQYM